MHWLVKKTQRRDDCDSRPATREALVWTPLSAAECQRRECREEGGEKKEDSQAPVAILDVRDPAGALECPQQPDFRGSDAVFQNRGQAGLVLSLRHILEIREYPYALTQSGIPARDEDQKKCPDGSGGGEHGGPPQKLRPRSDGGPSNQEQG